MKEAKKVFLYVEKAKNSARMKNISAISEDEEHKFDFKLDVDNYNLSASEMKSAFEKFCIDECGFDDRLHCEIWLLNADKLDENSDFENDIGCWLGQVDWGCYMSVELSYRDKNSHIKEIKSFEDFKVANNYDVTKEPFETKRIYDIYKYQIDKDVFDNDEINTMASFLSNNNYQAVFDAMTQNYPLQYKLRETLYRLYRLDKVEYEKQITGIGNALIRRAGKFIARFIRVFYYMPQEYHEEFDHDDFEDYESDDKNVDTPLYMRKYFDIFPESDLKTLLYAMSAARVLEETKSVLTDCSELKDGIENNMQNEDILFRTRECGRCVALDCEREYNIKSYESLVNENSDIREELIYEFNRGIYLQASKTFFDKLKNSIFSLSN